MGSQIRTDCNSMSLQADIRQARFGRPQYKANTLVTYRVLNCYALVCFYTVLPRCRLPPLPKRSERSGNVELFLRAWPKSWRKANILTAAPLADWQVKTFLAHVVVLKRGSDPPG
jgi:hypothetical protein